MGRNPQLGKTDALALLCWLVYCACDDGRALILTPSHGNAAGAAYRAVRRLYMQSGRCADCHDRMLKGEPVGRPCPHSALVPAVVHESAEDGVKSPTDLREIRAISTRSEEAAQGIAGKSLWIFADESSGRYLDKLVGAMAGNRAGGAHMALFGNPIRSTGAFAEAFGAKADFYETRRYSSEETPNVKAGRIVIPGLATRDWIEEQAAEYGGRSSPFYRMRVLGQHVTAADGAIFPADLIEDRAAAWRALRNPETGDHFASPDGPLVISVDPAEAPDGDEAGFMVRRGNDILEMYGRKGLSPDAHVAEVIGLLGRYRFPVENVPVMIDAAGDVGARVKAAFVVFQASNADSWKQFRTVFVQSGQKAQRDPDNYLQVRDEMAAACLSWLQDGGCIPDDPKLKTELSRYGWLRNVANKNKCTPKDGPGGLREQLGRSPTYADLLMLSTWARGEASVPVAPAVPAARNEREALDQLQRPPRLPSQEDPRVSRLRSESANIFRALDPYRRR
jgi:phage terminase large subunit